MYEGVKVNDAHVRLYDLQIRITCSGKSYVLQAAAPRFKQEYPYDGIPACVTNKDD
jgi:hypothetical protein